jgi:hypothetical protein
MKHTIRLLFIDDTNDNPAILDTILYEAGFAFYESKMLVEFNGKQAFSTLEEIEAYLEDK